MPLRLEMAVSYSKQSTGHDSNRHIRDTLRRVPMRTDAKMDAKQSHRIVCFKVCAAPPAGGRLLADGLKLPLSAVRIVAGEKSRTKRVAVSGVTSDQVLALLQPQASRKGED